MTILERLPHGPEAVFIRDLITRDERTVSLSACFQDSMDRLGIPEARTMTSWLVEVLAQATIYLLPTDKPAAGVLAKIHSMECDQAFEPQAVLNFRLHRITTGYGPLQSFEGWVEMADKPGTSLATVRFAVYWERRES